MTFAEVKEEGKRRWDDVAGRIEVEGGDLDQTAHSTATSTVRSSSRASSTKSTKTATQCIIPLQRPDASGPPIHRHRYLGHVPRPVPLLNLVYPSVNAEIQEGMLNAYRESGFFPEWASPGHRDCMVGNNSASILADAYLNGPKVADTETLWKGLVNGTENVHPEVKSTGRIGHQYYNRLGYVPYDVGINENAARTLEYAYDDWAIYQLAKALRTPKGRAGEIRRPRPQLHVKLFDKETNLMRGRNEDGSFQSPFSPLKWGDAFTEGNAWHYMERLPRPSGTHRPDGRQKGVHGHDGLRLLRAAAFRRQLLRLPDPRDTRDAGDGHGQLRPTATSQCSHTIYLYDWAGEPWKAQYWTREVMDKLYTPRPDGYCGDEDNGQTSAWYVFSSLGFYPVAPAPENTPSVRRSSRKPGYISKTARLWKSTHRETAARTVTYRRLR